MKKLLLTLLFGTLALLVSGCAESEVITGDMTQGFEMATTSTLQTIATTMITTKASKGKYPMTLAEVGQIIGKSELSPCTAPGIPSKTLNNYVYEMIPDQEWTGDTFYVRARPENSSFGKKCFMLDSSGTVKTVDPWFTPESPKQ